MAPVCRDVRRRTGKTVLKKALLSQKKIPEERRDPTKIAPSWESGGKPTSTASERSLPAVTGALLSSGINVSDGL
jgi:hypothetical protein